MTRNAKTLAAFVATRRALLAAGLVVCVLGGSARAAQKTDFTFTITGPDRKPIIGAVFQMVGPEGVVFRSIHGPRPFLVGAVKSGNYTFLAYANGYDAVRGRARVFGKSARKDVVLRKSAPSRQCRVQVAFFDKATLKPLDGVAVTYGYRSSFRKDLKVNRSINLGPHAPGIYWMRCWKRGYKKFSPTIVLAGRSTVRDYYLEPETNKNMFIYTTCKDAQTGAAVKARITIMGPGVNKAANTSGNFGLFGSGREGKWLVTATASGYQPYRREFDIVKSGPGKHIAIVMTKAGGSVPAGAKKHYATFVFTDARGKGRLNGVRYSVSGSGSTFRGTANGQVRVGPLAGGMHLFTFERGGYNKVVMRSNVGSSGTIPISMVKQGDSVAVAPAKNYLSIAPLPSTGSHPLTGAQVVVQGPSGRKAQVISAKNVSAVFYDLRPGTYVYTVTAAGYGQLTGRVRMGTTSRESKVLKLKPSAMTVSVLVVDEKNVPVQRAVIQAMGPGGRREKVSTNKAGQARLKLFTGEWGVTASAGGLQPVSRKLKVPANGVSRFTLKFPRGGLGFSVMSAVGVRPVTGARVAVTSARGNFGGTADSRGACILANLPQGAYRYTVTAPGYSTGSGGYLLRSTSTMAISVKLQPSSSDLVVSIIDARTRKPVSGATVSVSSRGFRKDAVSTSAGRISLKQLKGGEYVVRASSPGYQTIARRWVPSEGSAVTLSLQRPPLGVRVLDEAGKPIVGASVTAYWSYKSGFARRSKKRNATVYTGITGQCWIPVGSRTRAVKTVMVKARGYNGISRTSVRVPVELRFKLSRIIPPSEQKATLTVKVLDATARKPLAGASVRVESGVRRLNLTSSAAGVAVFKDVPWGSWRVHAGRDGYSGRYSDVKLDKSGDKSVTLQLSTRVPRFVFTVANSAGKPVGGARITLQWRPNPRIYRYKYDRGETNAKGEAALYNASTSDPRAMVIVVKDGLPTLRTRLGRVSGRTPYRKALRLAPPVGKPATLTVTVADARTGAKIGGALVSGTAGGRTYSATTAPGTGVAVVKGLPLNTRYSYTVTRSGYASASTSVTLTGEARSGLRLQPAITRLAVTVQSYQRRPIAGASVSVFWGDARSGKTLSRRAVTDRNGRATFSDTPTALPLSLSVSARGYKPRIQQVNRGTRNVSLQLAR